MNPAGDLYGILGDMRSHKSTKAYQLMEGRGIFYTFKGVPPHLPQLPRYRDTQPYLDGLLNGLKRDTFIQVIGGENFLAFLRKLQQLQGVTVCFDDLQVLMDLAVDEKGERIGWKRVSVHFDNYVRQIGQRHHRVLFNTHRITEVSIFLRQNAALYYCGPCSREDTLKDLWDESHINMPKDAFMQGLQGNAKGNLFQIKPSVF